MLIIQQVVILLKNNGMKSFKYFRMDNYFHSLIWLTKDSLLETLIKMLMYFKLGLKQVNPVSLDNLMQKIWDYMVTEPDVLVGLLKIKKKQIKLDLA